MSVFLRLQLGSSDFCKAFVVAINYFQFVYYMEYFHFALDEFGFLKSIRCLHKLFLVWGWVSLMPLLCKVCLRLQLGEFRIL